MIKTSDQTVGQVVSGVGPTWPQTNQLSAIYERKYYEGYTEAVFEYVRRDVFAFRETWVVEEIERALLAGTPEGRAWLQRLMAAYTGKQTRTRIARTPSNGEGSDGVALG